MIAVKIMYCNRCGKENPEDAVYCKKCGALMEAEEETRVAAAKRPNADFGMPNVSAMGTEIDSRLTEAGEAIFSISPTLKFVYGGYVLAILAAFLIVGLVAIFIPAVSPIFAVVLGLLILLAPVYFHIRKKLVRYRLTDTTIEIDRGLVSRTTQNIPLRRIQDVTVSATLVQRILGFGDIVIDNASEDGGKVVLDDIDSPRKYADLLLRQMRQLDR